MVLVVLQTVVAQNVVDGHIRSDMVALGVATKVASHLSIPILHFVVAADSASFSLHCNFSVDERKAANKVF